MKTRKMKKGTGILLVIVSIFLLCTLVIGSLFSHFYDKMNYERLAIENGEQTEVSEQDPELLEFYKFLEENGLKRSDIKFDDKDVLNVLLVGVDGHYSNEYGRSDSMIILSINKRTHKIVLTSLLRDSYVYIPGHGSDRLNGAYSDGGMNLLIETILYNYNIPITKYAKVDFEAFKDIIDTVGGVTVNLSQEELNYICSGNPSHDNRNLNVGSCTLDSTQALCYARCRHIDNDFERTRRQRDVIQSIMNEAKNMSLMELKDMADMILPDITTNITQSDILGLITYAREYSSYKVESFSLPRPGQYQEATVNGRFVIKVDFRANAQYFFQQVYE